MPRCHGDALAGAVLSSTELPEKEVGKCPCGRLYGLSVGEERIHFHRAEIPVRQHSHELPGLELCPRAVFARRGDPQPGDGARRGSFVDRDSEGRTADAGAASDCACAGANRATVQRDRLEDATRDVPLLRSAVQLCQLRPLDDSSSKRWSLGYPRDHRMPPGRLRYASGAPPARSFCSIASVIISAIVSLVTRPTNCPPRP